MILSSQSKNNHFWWTLFWERGFVHRRQRQAVNHWNMRHSNEDMHKCANISFRSINRFVSETFATITWRCQTNFKTNGHTLSQRMRQTSLSCWTASLRQIAQNGTNEDRDKDFLPASRTRLIQDYELLDWRFVSTVRPLLLQKLLSYTPKVKHSEFPLLRVLIISFYWSGRKSSN